MHIIFHASIANSTQGIPRTISGPSSSGTRKPRCLLADYPNVPIQLAALDDKLNNIGYIVPDFGDRQIET